MPPIPVYDELLHITRLVLLLGEDEETALLRRSRHYHDHARQALHGAHQYHRRRSHCGRAAMQTRCPSAKSLPEPNSRRQHAP
eukprot:6933071-Alexandrium_andersonii.AAC.1